MRSGLLQRGVTLTLALACALGPGGFAFAADKDEDHKADDEAFIAKILEIIEKTAAQAEDTALDKTPYGDLDGADAEAAAEIAHRLDNQRITLNFEDTSFNEALDFFRDATSLNIVLSKKAQDLVEGNPTKLKLRLKDVKTRNALELVLTQTDANFRYGLRHGVLEIGTIEDWKGRNMILDVIPIDDIIYRPPDFPAPEAGLDVLKFKKNGFK
jgi:hypothetical protein